MHPIIHIFGFDLPAYGAAVLIGAVVAALFAVFHNRGSRYIAQRDLGLAAVYALAGMLIGAKVLALITEIPFFISNASVIFSSVDSAVGAFMNGWVFYGGLIGGIIGTYMYCRSFKEDFCGMAAAAAPSIPLFHVFGRIGCFLGGCCYGVPWERGVVFTESLSAPNGVPLFPVQLVEACAELLIFAVLLIIQHRAREKWIVLPAYLLMYAPARFIIEFWRGDAIRGVFLLSTSQWVSIALVIVTSVLLFRYFRQKTAANTAAVQ